MVPAKPCLHHDLAWGLRGRASGPGRWLVLPWSAAARAHMMSLPGSPARWRQGARRGGWVAGQAVLRRVRRAVPGGVGRLCSRPWRAAAQAVQRGRWRRPWRVVLRCQHPGTEQTVPGPFYGGVLGSAGASPSWPIGPGHLAGVARSTLPDRDLGGCLRAGVGRSVLLSAAALLSDGCERDSEN